MCVAGYIWKLNGQRRRLCCYQCIASDSTFTVFPALRMESGLLTIFPFPDGTMLRLPGEGARETLQEERALPPGVLLTMLLQRSPQWSALTLLDSQQHPGASLTLQHTPSQAVF